MMTSERCYGSLDGRQLTLRWIRPWVWRLFHRSAWSLWLRRSLGSHRCYCRRGWSLDGQVLLAGYGVAWFYSHYRGDVPCCCDRVCEELFA